QTAWEVNNFTLVHELLDVTRPKQDESDLRGFEWYYWERLCHAELRSFKLDYTVDDASLRSGQVVLTADASRCAVIIPRPNAKGVVIKVWDLPECKEVFVLPFDDPGNMHVALSGDGQRLAVSLASGGMPGAGSRAPTALHAGRILLWDIRSRKQLGEF